MTAPGCSWWITEKQALVQGRIAGASDDIRAQFQAIEIPLRPGGGLHVQVALTGEPLLVEDMEQVKDQAYKPLLGLLGAHSLAVLPLKIEERVLGVLSVDNSRTQRMLTAADQRLLATLANQFAIAIANALAYRQIEQLNIGLEAKVQERTEALHCSSTNSRGQHPPGSGEPPQVGILSQHVT